jgi:hypothetical protein
MQNGLMSAVLCDDLGAIGIIFQDVPAMKYLAGHLPRCDGADETQRSICCW